MRKRSSGQNDFSFSEKRLESFPARLLPKLISFHGMLVGRKQFNSGVSAKYSGKKSGPGRFWARHNYKFPHPSIIKPPADLPGS